MEGGVSEVQIGGVPDRAAHQGRDRGRADRPRPHDARAWRAGGGRAATCSTPRARAAARPTFNVSTTAAFVAAGAGCARRQARQPLGHQPVAGRPTCSRRSAPRSTSSPRRSPRASTISASASCSPRLTTRPRATSCRSARRWRAHRLQLPRAADQPGRRHPPADRRRGPDDARADRRRALRARLRTGTGRLRHRWNRRDERHGRDHRGRGLPAATSRGARSRRRTSASNGSLSKSSPAASPSETPRSPARCSPAKRDRTGRS